MTTVLPASAVEPSTTTVSVSRLELEDIKGSTRTSITNVQYLSSYNWIGPPSATPTIAVSRSPALWSPPRQSKWLKKDSGFVYIAQNAARLPESPLEPLFRALYIYHPSFDIRSVEVVTDRNNIRKLLSFINHILAAQELKAFTINVKIVQNTVALSREESETCENIGPNEFRGYGMSSRKRTQRIRSVAALDTIESSRID